MTQKFLRDDGQFVPLAATGSSASGPVTLLTKSTTADITFPLIGSYVDGPSVAQGSSGTWLAAGTVTLQNATVATNVRAKLWDGTTPISATVLTIPIAGNAVAASLSGIMTSPAGNLRISCRSPASTATLMLFDGSANGGFDSTITVFRIG